MRGGNNNVLYSQPTITLPIKLTNQNTSQSPERSEHSEGFADERTLARS